jgi:membrane protease YdiL (CAAX protease family)
MKIKNWIKNRPIVSYFFLVFLISWGGSLLGGGGYFLQGKALELKDTLPMGIAMIGAPTLGGILMTYVCDGRQGIRDLFTRLTKWRIPARWYATLLIFPIMILVVLIPLSILVTPKLSPTFFVPGILMGLVAGFFEEIGWTGFAYPKMRLRLSVLRASIYLGLIHALWHVVADFLGNYLAFGPNWFLYFAAFFVFVIPLRVIIAWVYENTGSLLLVCLVHASSSGFLGVLVPIKNNGETWPIFYAVYAIVIWLVAAAIIFRNERRMVEQTA